MQLPVVVNTDDVTGIGRIHMHAFIGHKGERIGNLHLTVFADMAHLHAGAVAARADTEKGNTVAVARIHIGLNLEDKTCEGLFRGLNPAYAAVTGLGRRRPLHQGLKHILNTEVIHTGTEKDGALITGEKLIKVKGVACALNEFNGLSDVGHFHRKQCVKSRIIEPLNIFRFRCHLFRPRRKAVQTVVQQRKNAPERLAR